MSSADEERLNSTWPALEAKTNLGDPADTKAVNATQDTSTGDIKAGHESSTSVIHVHDADAARPSQLEESVTKLDDAKQDSVKPQSVIDSASSQLAGLDLKDAEHDQASLNQQKEKRSPTHGDGMEEVAERASPTLSSGQAEAQEEWNEKQDHDLHPDPMLKPEQEFDEKQKEGESSEERPEIETIVQQFSHGQDQASEDTASPQRTELPVFQYPPRSSSLETALASSKAPNVSSQTDSETVPSPRSHGGRSISSLSAPAPPEPDPEPSLPFDFHRFLEQLRHRTADPVAKFLRSFLLEFGKKQWQVHEQVKIISDFLTFISGKMSQCDVWRNVSDAEFGNAREGMEKLVMNRLYNQTFSPEIPPAESSPNKAKRKGTPGLGRRGQHEEDVERDEVLAQKVRIYSWVREEHLDMQPFGEKGRKFLSLAQAELQKIKSYRAPRDKVICVLNTCKVIFGFLRSAHSKDTSADAFIPLLIWTVLKADPEHLVSNVQYILRFRNQDKLNGEAGYYMSSLMGAVQFIENLDRTNLTISDEEFEANVEQAVSSFQEGHKQVDAEEKPRRSLSPSAHPTFNEKASLARPEVTPRHSMEGERSSPRRDPPRHSDMSSNDETEDDNAAVAGLLRTIQKPLSTIGRIFSDDTSSHPPPITNRPPSTPQPNVSARPPRISSMQPQISSGLPQLPGSQAQKGSKPQQQPGIGNTAPETLATANRTPRYTTEEAAARQASAESAQAQQVTQAEHRTVVE